MGDLHDNLVIVTPLGHPITGAQRWRVAVWQGQPPEVAVQLVPIYPAHLLAFLLAQGFLLLTMPLEPDTGEEETP